MVALVLSFGLVISASSGRPSIALPLDPGPPALSADEIVLVGMHSPMDHGLPRPLTRDGLTEADAEEEDDEMVALRRVLTSSVLNLAVKVRRQDQPTASHDSGDGLLHELHYSWQLLC